MSSVIFIHFLLFLPLWENHVLKQWYLGSDNGSLNACWIGERILLRNHLFETRVPLSSLTSYCTVEFQDSKTIPEGTLSKQFSIFSLRDFHTVVWLQPSGICKVDLDSEQLLSEIIIRARHKNIRRVDEILSCACTTVTFMSRPWIARGNQWPCGFLLSTSIIPWCLEPI